MQCVVSVTALTATAQDLSGEARDEPGTPAGSDTPGGSDDGDFDKYLQARSSITMLVHKGIVVGNLPSIVMLRLCMVSADISA